MTRIWPKLIYPLHRSKLKAKSSLPQLKKHNTVQAKAQKRQNTNSTVALLSLFQTQRALNTELLLRLLLTNERK